MQLFRNPSVRRGAVFYAVLLAAGVCIGWQIAPACAALAAALCMAAALFAFVSARRRYARIAALSADIDSILHGAMALLHLWNIFGLNWSAIDLREILDEALKKSKKIKIVKQR